MDTVRNIYLLSPTIVPFSLDYHKNDGKRSLSNYDETEVTTTGSIRFFLMTFKSLIILHDLLTLPFSWLSSSSYI